MNRRATPRIIVSTFSIVARDPATGDFGVAVASKYLAVGAGVPAARARIGAVATQADVNLAWGAEGLALLATGATADEALARLVAADTEPAGRQAGIVDRFGNAATYTGPRCMDWAGGTTGDGFACQGNILAGPEVVEEMADAYQRTAGPFAQRLLAALDAGDEAGGDRRGRQAAAMLIVREKGGYGGRTDRWLDLRVDDHPTPLVELRRLVALHNLYFNTDDAVLLPFDREMLSTIARHLARLGWLSQGETEQATIEEAFERWAGQENLEMRIRSDGQIDALVLEMLTSSTA